MIEYELFCKIKDYHQNRHLTMAQIGRELNLDERTVAKWLDREKFRQPPLVIFWDIGDRHVLEIQPVL